MAPFQELYIPKSLSDICQIGSSGFRVWGLEFRVQSLEFKVQSSRFRVQGLEFGGQRVKIEIWNQNGLIGI